MWVLCSRRNLIATIILFSISLTYCLRLTSNRHGLSLATRTRSTRWITTFILMSSSPAEIAGVTPKAKRKHQPASRAVITNVPSAIASATKRNRKIADEPAHDVQKLTEAKSPDPDATKTPPSSKRVQSTSKRETAASSTTKYKNEIQTSIEGVEWIRISVPLPQLCLNLTLRMGQCFNWRRLDESDESDSSIWVGTIDNIPLAIRQLPELSTIEFANLLPDIKLKPLEPLVREYFQLSHDLEALYVDWAASCPRMKVITQHLVGVRVVRQDPWECLISFICSSNNNIKRITLMLDSLKKSFGTYLCSLEKLEDTGKWRVTSRQSDLLASSPNRGSDDQRIDFFTFPSIPTLATCEESALRELGFGYRAKFVVQTAQLIAAKDTELQASTAGQWLLDLRACRDPIAVQDALCTLQGVGKKVADCVALFSLDQAAAIPIDTHVRDIAVRDYGAQLATTTNTITGNTYTRTAAVLQARFGEKAGWAHSVLFAAELPEFRKRLPDELQREMKDFADQRKSDKAALVAAKKLQKEEGEGRHAVATTTGKSDDELSDEDEAANILLATRSGEAHSPVDSFGD